MRSNKAFYRKWFYERKVPMVSDAFTMTPFDILSLMRGLPNFLIDLYRRPEKVIEASDAIIDGLIALGEFPIKGLSGKIIFQGSQQSSADIVSPSQFEKFSFPYLKKMTEEFAKDGFISHLHHHNNWTPFLEYLKDFPKRKCILYLDDKTDIFKAKEVLGDSMCLMGNVSASLLSLGTPKKVEEATKKILEGCADGGGLIISCENPPDARFENLKALVDATKKYGVYRA
jgi:uroporphyrinogen-III decarboxylase